VTGKRRRHHSCPAVHWHIDFLVALPSAQDLLLCAKYLFVGCHGGSGSSRALIFGPCAAPRRRHELQWCGS